MPTSNKPFAEIIESSLALWRAQCWQWDFFPTFGSLVTITSGKRTLFGIITGIETGSNDPMRQPIAYKKTEAELRAQQPQIFEFLQTICYCAPLGYLEHDQLFYHLPPQPPKIHAFVQAATSEQKKLFLAGDQYLPLLFARVREQGGVDELLLAFIKEQHADIAWNAQRLTQLFTTLSTSTRIEYRALKHLIERAHSLLQSTP